MEKLLRILEELHPEVDFENCDHLIDNQVLDSFDIISIIAEVSEQFDVIVSAEDIVPENFNSLKAMYHLIQKLENSSEA